MALRRSRWTLGHASSAALAAGLALFSQSARAVSIELKDAGPDRIERQRAAAEGRLPLAGTPDMSQFAARLAEKGLAAGAPVFIRIFKAQSELEVWVEKGSAYVLFATYPVCHWSGTLGPKVRQGDKQSPEGFYTISRRQLHLSGRWPRALNLGYPNAFDRAQTRNGAYILIHGGCSSVGCFAMTNPVISEIYDLTEAALNGGQHFIPIHVFPFRMTTENLDKYKTSEWRDFWLNLKEGYDAFEETHRPPRVSVCENRYFIQSPGPLEPALAGPVGVCGQTAAAIEDVERLEKLVPLPVLRRLWAGARSGSSITASLASQSLTALGGRGVEPGLSLIENFNRPRRWLAGANEGGRSCSPSLPSCRKFIALQDRADGTRRLKTAAKSRGRRG